MLPAARGLGLQSHCRAAVADDAAEPGRRVPDGVLRFAAVPRANAVAVSRRRHSSASGAELQGIKVKEVRTWTSKDVAHSLPAKDRPSILRARCALIPFFRASAPARAVAASVTFEPGARTAWHTHPLGQTLIVTAGCGRAQRWGGPIEEIRPGDVIWFPPGEKHWHGACANHGHDTPRHPGTARRENRRLDGTGQGPRLPSRIKQQSRL